MTNRMNEMITMDKRFQLEQDIMNAWHIVDDLETAYHYSDTMDQDTIMNLLLGMKTLYQFKFEKLFDSFEKFVNETEDKNYSWMKPDPLFDDPTISDK